MDTSVLEIGYSKNGNNPETLDLCLGGTTITHTLSQFLNISDQYADRSAPVNRFLCYAFSGGRNRSVADAYGNALEDQIAWILATVAGDFDLSRIDDFENPRELFELVDEYVGQSPWKDVTYFRLALAMQLFLLPVDTARTSLKSMVLEKRQKFMDWIGIQYTGDMLRGPLGMAREFTQLTKLIDDNIKEVSGKADEVTKDVLTVRAMTVITTSDFMRTDLNKPDLDLVKLAVSRTRALVKIDDVMNNFRRFKQS